MTGLGQGGWAVDGEAACGDSVDVTLAEPVPGALFVTPLTHCPQAQPCLLLIPDLRASAPWWLLLCLHR